MARCWWVLGGCALLAVPTGLDPDGPVAGPSYLLGLTLVVSALWWAASGPPGRDRTSWRLLAAAASCWLAGDVAQRLAGWTGGSADGVGLPDLFWLSSYPLLIAAVVRLVRARGLPDALRREIALDVVVVGAGAGVWAWYLLMAPTLRDGRTASAVVGAIYPLGDVVVFALALTLLMAPGRRGAATWLLIGCLGLTLPLDVLQTVLPELAPGLDPSRLDGGLLVVNGMLSAAALHPDRTALTRHTEVVEGHALHRWRVVLLGFSLCAASAATALPGHAAADLAPSLASTLVMTVAVVVRFYRVVRDREQAEARLRHAATHDLLTGAARRHLLMERLARAVAGHEDAAGPVLVFLDLDGFKAVNDTLGHAAGDAVLCAVAARLLRLFRATDTVARIGGDEFVVLAHDVGALEAAGIGERVRAAVVLPVPLGAGQARVGASVGVLTMLRTEALDADDLLRRADAAMYEAKRDGSGVRTRPALV